MNYKQRIVIERNMLIIKYNKLLKFLKSDQYLDINLLEQKRLLRQELIMKLYIDVLEERINNY